MTDRKHFLINLSKSIKRPTRTDLAIALLWYYDFKQEYEERTVSDLVQDIKDDSFGNINIIKLRKELKKSKFTVKGLRSDAFRINSIYFSELSKKFGFLINIKNIDIDPSMIPAEYFKGTRTYLERIVDQINGSYNSGWLDACAVIIRRLMELLIIEVYINNGLEGEIKDTNNLFFPLNTLLTRIKNNNKILKSRDLAGNMDMIKDVGDTAAHNRTYITKPADINGHKIRTTIDELITLAKLKEKK